jgi:hypothetical protein
LADKKPKSEEKVNIFTDKVNPEKDRQGERDCNLKCTESS